MRIAFVSTRLAGTDGVSLEADKWAQVLTRMGHQVYYCAGELSGQGPEGVCIPSMHFRDPVAVSLGQRAFAQTSSDAGLTEEIDAAAQPLYDDMSRFVRRFRIEVMIVENAQAIPMQLPLAKALSRLIILTDIPTIGHHHDFYWERPRFADNCIPEFLDTYFPLDAPSLRHVTINSLARRDLLTRRGG